jgi:hypothetical protein
VKQTFDTVLQPRLPILVTSFNRPELLQRVLFAIRDAGFSDIFFASDGPRNFEDFDRISQCEAIFRNIFPKVTPEQVLLRKSNLGCRMAMFENVKWFFSKVEYGVVLEDDCLPSPDFFDFMKGALAMHGKDKDVFLVSGYNPLQTSNDSKKYVGYRKSIYPLVWGWGSWADRISGYTLDFSDYKNVVECGGLLAQYYRWNWAARQKWQKLMKLAGQGELDTWDYSLTASAWRSRQYSLHSEINLIENIGFGPEATHTTKKAPEWATRQIGGRLHEFKYKNSVSYEKIDSCKDRVLEIQIYTLHLSGLIRLHLALRKKFVLIRFQRIVKIFQQLKRKLSHAG